MCHKTSIASTWSCFRCGRIIISSSPLISPTPPICGNSMAMREFPKSSQEFQFSSIYTKRMHQWNANALVIRCKDKSAHSNVSCISFQYFYYDITFSLSLSLILPPLASVDKECHVQHFSVFILPLKDNKTLHNFNHAFCHYLSSHPHMTQHLCCFFSSPPGQIHTISKFIVKISCNIFPIKCRHFGHSK